MTSRAFLPYRLRAYSGTILSSYSISSRWLEMRHPSPSKLTFLLYFLSQSAFQPPCKPDLLIVPVLALVELTLYDTSLSTISVLIHNIFQHHLMHLHIYTLYNRLKIYCYKFYDLLEIIQSL